jgi:hypothetical protein
LTAVLTGQIINYPGRRKERKILLGITTVRNGVYTKSRTLPNAEKASALTRTQVQAIAKAKQLNPDKKPHIERVEDTTKGKPDKFRP